MSRVLLVSRDSGIKDELGERLKSVMKDLALYQATNAEEARKYLADQDYDLAVIDLHVPADVKTPTLTDKTPGLDLANWMRKSDYETPCILVRPKRLHATPELDAKIGDLSRCAPVHQGADMFSDLVSVAKYFHSGKQPKMRARVEIEVRLGGRKRGSGENEFSVYEPATGSKTTGGLNVEEERIQDMAALSQAAGAISEWKDREWKQAFRRVGFILIKMLKKNAAFRDAVTLSLKKIDDMDDYCHPLVRFVVPREFHSVAFEAIVDDEKNADEESDSDLWMLEAPVYRVLYGEDINRIKVGPLFARKSTRPIRCVLIDANIDRQIDSGEPNPRNPKHNLYLDHLPLVSEECDELVERLRKVRQHFNIAEPVLLRRKRGERGFWNRVQDHLKDDWDLVHYAGHSYYDEKSNRALVFFQEDNDHVESVTVTQFANELRSARLVFLSSCQSASEGFVFELAESGVPGIIGFRWPIEDEFAVEFAHCFYNHLFEQKSVDEAFFLARCQMHKKHKERKVWASPVLIEQRI